MEVVDENVFLTGDEDGCIKMWDMRRFVPPPRDRVLGHAAWWSSSQTNIS